MVTFDKLAEEVSLNVPVQTKTGILGRAEQSCLNMLMRVRNLFSFNLRNLILAMMLGVSIVPVSLLYKWVEHSTFQKELSYVRENHLIIAKNLSAAFTRYVIDLESVFSLAVQNREIFHDINDLQLALANFDLCHVEILSAQNQRLSMIKGTMDHPMTTLSADMLVYLRRLAANANGEIALSGIRRHHGEPHFFLVQQLPGNQLAIAPWDPKYILELQKSISFGQRGHSMVVDQDGLVIGHPNPEWQASSKDVSKLPVVQAMMSGDTGVMQFFSPPMNADMIAGYTSVPGIGWGVMVPQPLSELVGRAQDVQSAAFLIAAAEIFLAMMISLWLSSLLADPILAIVDSAKKVSGGDFSVRVGKLPDRTPDEIRQLATTFDRMVDDLARKSDSLKHALAKAEEISAERAELLVMANQANEVKSQFVSMVSHELRTPLTSIKGALELLDSGAMGDLPKKSKKLVSIAVKNSRRLALMINDLLDLDRLGAGKMSFDFADMDLGQMIEDSTEANKAYGELNDVTFRTFNTGGQLMVKGDQNRLMQVMANLLSNAAKFSKPGGFVDVTLSLSETNANISVKDYGIGIPDTAKEKVFEKFFQLDSSDARKFGGSGLGLGIAKVIVEKHGGQINYSSRKDKGTTFYFDLPLNGSGLAEG